MGIEDSTSPALIVSRSDIVMVAVGFSPRSRCNENRVAERRLTWWLISNCCRYAAQHSMTPPFRGLKPTAIVIASLCEATPLRSDISS